MANKFDTSTWSSFTKKQGLELDDGALLKALAKFDKTDASKPEARLEALKDLVDQLDKQVVALTKRKKELGDKPFALAKDKLHALRELAESEQKQARAAVADSGDDAEADSPVLLTTKMVPLVKELRKGEARMPVLITTAGRELAVLIMRRAISTTRRKLMLDYLGVQGGAKHFQGECLFESGALTFVVASPSAGMAKRLRQALLDQLELRLKVRVRGDDGAEEVDGDGEEDGAAQEGVQAQKSAPPQGGPASAAATAYTQRLRKVRERLDAALRAQHPAASKLRAVIGFASEKAAAEDYPAASKALDMLDKLLDAPVASGEGAAAAQAYAQRLEGLQPRLDQALRDSPPEAAKLQALGVLAREKAAVENYAAAMQALVALEKLLDGMPARSGQTADAALAEVLQARLQTVREDAQRLRATAQFDAALSRAAQAVQAHDRSAAAQLDALEQQLAALAGEQRAAAAAATAAASQTAGGVGVVAFAKMRLELQDVRVRFDDAIDNLQTSFEALLDSEDFVDDPRSSDPATRARIETIAQRLPSFPALADSVNAAIDDMAGEPDPARRQRHSEAALKKIADFRARIDAEPMLTEMESTEAGTFPIHATMVAALEKIATALRA